MSQFSRRANERVAAARVFDMEDGDSNPSSPTSGSCCGFGESSPCSPSAATGGMRDAVQKKFDNLVSEIDAALSGGKDQVQTARVVHRDIQIRHSLHVHEGQYYRIPLQSKPSAINVLVSCLSGVAPCVWASTSNPRPSQKDHDYQAKDGKLVHRHLPAQGADEHGADRAQDAPEETYLSKDLFVHVEAMGGECCYALLMTVANVYVVGKRGPKTPRVKGLAAKLAALQDQAAREALQEHLRARREAQLRRFAGLQDFVQRNARKLEEALPEARHRHLELQALQELERQHVNRQRRQGLEEATEQRRVAWTMRNEERKREREMAEREHERQHVLRALQKDWLTRLAACIFSSATSAQWAQLKQSKEHMHRRLLSARTIASWLAREVSRRRRQNLYRNVVRLRVALMAQARQLTALRVHVAQPIVHAFIEAQCCHREVVDVRSVMRRFRILVVRLQRWYRARRRTWGAYAALLRPYWLAAQESAYGELLGAAAAAELERLQNKRRIIGDVRGLQASPSAPELQRRSSVSKDGAQARQLAEVRSLVEQREEWLPDYVIASVLTQYVVRMLNARKERVSEWEKEQQASEVARDLGGVFATQSDELAPKVNPKPGPIYIDECEIADLVRGTIVQWKSGRFRHMKANRLRLLRKAWSSIKRSAPFRDAR